MNKREIKEYFEECEFKSEGNDCDECGKNKKGERIWYERSSHESDEGYYYCDKCAIKRIKTNA